MCVFFTDESSYNFNESSQLCENQEGRLPVLDTKKKNRMVFRMIKRNSSKSSTIPLSSAAHLTMVQPPINGQCN